VAISLLVIWGCVELDEITQFAKTSQDVGKAFPDMADEAQTSCDRANSFQNTQNLPASLDCKVYVNLKPSLVKINAALFNYIASLGKLASADLTKVPGGFDSLSADLKQADPSISTENQGKATAASSLAKAITNVWANGYRQHELSKLIGENNQAVQQVTDFLSNYAADKFAQSLKDEWRFESAYCTGVTADAEPLAYNLLMRKCSADKARIELQLSAIKSYQGALATIASTHQKLYDERSHWDAKKLSKYLGPQIVSLGSAAVSVNKAF
jgi:hypothetical protein